MRVCCASIASAGSRMPARCWTSMSATPRPWLRRRAARGTRSIPPWWTSANLRRSCRCRTGWRPTRRRFPSPTSDRLSPAEQPLDVHELELDVGGPAVIALAAVGRRLHLAQQRVHLGRREAASGAHAAVAGERAAELLELLLEGEGLAELRQLIGEVAHQTGNVDLAEERGHLAHDHGAGAKRLDHEAELGEFLGPRREPLHRGLLELDHLGDEQELARNAGRRHRILHTLVDQALVGGVLID